MLDRLMQAALYTALTGALAFVARRIAPGYGIQLHLRSSRAGAILLCGWLGELLSVALHGDRSVFTALTGTLPGTVVSAATDSVSGYVFDAVTFPSLIASLIFAFCDHHVLAAVAGTVAGGLPLAVLYAITAGRGLGLGDVKLACCIGAGLGARGALLAVGMAFVCGGIYAAYVLLTRKAQRGTEVYFAPYLALGAVLVDLIGAAG